MRQVLTLLILIILAACSQHDAGGEIPATAVPSSEWVLPDLTVSNVSLRWSQVWECGVDVHVTIANLGTASIKEFTLSLHDRREIVNKTLVPQAQHTVIFNVTGDKMAKWMEASGMVDVDNVIRESDETNNSYRHPLPYSAVPGLESISICNMSQTPPSATKTPT